ncbi:unnamed protein product [Orchesella dallaii]|uniref:Transmembrane protein n=1 Tax=Orchesella dallaii TaxID=48710 RepID=A0ABP1RIK6_9HEXA
MSYETNSDSYSHLQLKWLEPVKFISALDLFLGTVHMLFIITDTILFFEDSTLIFVLVDLVRGTIRLFAAIWFVYTIYTKGPLEAISTAISWRRINLLLIIPYVIYLTRMLAILSQEGLLYRIGLITTVEDIWIFRYFFEYSIYCGLAIIFISFVSVFIKEAKKKVMMAMHQAQCAANKPEV